MTCPKCAFVIHAEPQAANLALSWEKRQGQGSDGDVDADAESGVAGAKAHSGTAGIGDQPDANDTVGTPVQQQQQIEWTTPNGPAQWAKLFGYSPTTLKRRLKDGTIRHKKLSAKSYQLAVDDLPAKHQEKHRNAKK